jgi:hypothetical protein
MIARYLDIDCKRCRGTGRVAVNRMTTTACSCPAGRSIATVTTFIWPHGVMPSAVDQPMLMVIGRRG